MRRIGLLVTLALVMALTMGRSTGLRYDPPYF
jgi:hypothetical protein